MVKSNTNNGNEMSTIAKQDLIKVGSRVKATTDSGHLLGVVTSVTPEWYWPKCQYVVDFEVLGTQRLPAGFGLELVEPS